MHRVHLFMHLCTCMGRSIKRNRQVEDCGWIETCFVSAEARRGTIMLTKIFMSSSIMVKSKMSAFSRILSGLIDFGIPTQYMYLSVHSNG